MDVHARRNTIARISAMIAMSTAAPYPSISTSCSHAAVSGNRFLTRPSSGSTRTNVTIGSSTSHHK